VKENVVALNNENDELWSNMCLTVWATLHKEETKKLEEELHSDESVKAKLEVEVQQEATEHWRPKEASKESKATSSDEEDPAWGNKRKNGS
jgi:hypothetical protein